MYTTLKVSSTKLRYALMSKLMSSDDDVLTNVADVIFKDQLYDFSIDNYGIDDSALDRL